jgi:hypothetical protein
MKRIATLIAGLALLLPSAALAQAGGSSPTCQSYNPKLCQVANTSTARSATTSTTSSTLPFTGLDVVLLAAGGGTLLVAGLFVRRVSANPRP